VSSAFSCLNNDCLISDSALIRAFSSLISGDPGSAASLTLTKEPRGERPNGVPLCGVDDIYADWDDEGAGGLVVEATGADRVELYR
jgi:hypothetical protein